MNGNRRFYRVILLVAILATWAVTRPAWASVPLTIDFSDGYTFSGVQRVVDGSGVAQLPLGANYLLVASSIEVKIPLGAGGSGHVRAIFPGQGGQTILIDTGDPILFEYSFMDVPFEVRVRDIDTSADFGGGLGEEFTFNILADVLGTGLGAASIDKPNLGFLMNPNLSLSLGNADGFFAQHDLGVDLNGDTTNDVLKINNFVIAGFGPNGWLFDYSVLAGDSILYIDDFMAPPANGSGSVNPNFGLTLTINDWSLEMDRLIAPVPEPSSMALAAVGLVACAAVGRRRARSRRNVAR
jgi:hypothetical protein